MLLPKVLSFVTTTLAFTRNFKWKTKTCYLVIKGGGTGKFMLCVKIEVSGPQTSFKKGHVTTKPQAKHSSYPLWLKKDQMSLCVRSWDHRVDSVKGARGHEDPHPQ